MLLATKSAGAARQHARGLPGSFLLQGCTSALFFEARKRQDCYLWAAKVHLGPTIKFLIVNGAQGAERKSQTQIFSKIDCAQGIQQDYTLISIHRTQSEAPAAAWDGGVLCLACARGWRSVGGGPYRVAVLVQMFKGHLDYAWTVCRGQWLYRRGTCYQSDKTCWYHTGWRNDQLHSPQPAVCAVLSATCSRQ